MQNNNDIVPFHFGEKEVRVVFDETNEPWWVAKDVCEILQYKEVSKTLSKLDDDEKGTKIFRTLGGNQKMTIINESGLYTLILRSNKPEAKRFKKWVTAEVLPSIRKTGSYSTCKSKTDESDLLGVVLKLVENQQRQTDAILSLAESITQRPLTIEHRASLDTNDRKRLREAVLSKTKQAAQNLGVAPDVLRPSLWIDIKKKFKVDDYQDIPKEYIDDAIEFVQQWCEDIKKPLAMPHI